MAFLMRRLSRKAASVVAEDSYSIGTGNVWFRVLRSFAVGSTGSLNEFPTLSKERKVGVFWDLDNKPPKNVSPFEAAKRLLKMAAEFGSVVEAVAYANRHAFSHVPAWIREESKQRKMLDELKARELLKPQELYVCRVWGAKKKIRVELTKHCRSLHEREQKKRMNRLDSLKGKKKQNERFWDKSAEKMSKYKEVARSLLLPKVGYGLMQDPRRAGVFVRTVQDKPQAADMALQDHMTKSIITGVRCICLVSDDSDFTAMLKIARERNLHTVVVGDLRILSEYADTYFSWADGASGRAEDKAKRETTLLMANFMNTVGDRLKNHRYKGFGFEDEQDSQSDSNTEFPDGKGWRPHDGRVRSDDNPSQDFAFFSDDSLESDSEAEPDNRPPKPRKMRSFGGNSKLGSEVPSISRREFSTERTVDAEQTAFTDNVSESDLRASLPKGSRGAPVKTNASSLSLHSTDGIALTRLRASASSSTNKGNPSCEASSSANAEPVNSIVRSFPDRPVPSSAFEEERGLELDIKNLGRLEDTNLGARDSFGGEAASVHDKVIGRGRKKRKMFDEEDVDKRKRKISKEKAKHHRGGGLSEPVPFYMSGFASESQEDCDGINDWYFGFWRNDGREEFRGRRTSTYKKKN